MIAKVQTPLSTNEAEPLALLYNQDRSCEIYLPITEDLLSAMDGEHKRFFHVTVIGDCVEITDNAPWQDW